MIAHTEQQKPHLSATQLEMFARCGMQWYYRYVEKDIEPPGAAMLQGRAVHKGIEADLGYKMENGVLLPEQDLADLTRDVVVSEWSESGVSLTEDEAADGEGVVRGRVVDNAIAFTMEHHRRLAPIIEPVYLERRFDLELPGYPYDLMGFIDIQEPNGIRDTKTKNKRAPSQDDVDSSLQLSMYSMAAKVLDGERPSYISLDALVLQKGGVKAVTLETERTDDDDAALMQRVDFTVEMIDKEHFHPAPPDHWCCSPKWCGWYDRCPYGSARRMRGFVNGFDE